MNLHSASYRPLVPWMAAWFLLLGGCSAIEIGNGQLQDRPFEPAPIAPVAVESLPEPPLDQTVDLPADTVPQEISDGLSEPRVDPKAVERILADLNPDEGDSTDLEARHAPAAGAVASETLSADFFRRMNARAQALHTLQKGRREAAVELPRPKTKNSDAPGAESGAPPANAVLPPPDNDDTDRAVRDGLEEPQFVARRVARLPSAVGPGSDAMPKPDAGISVRIDFVGDQIESSPAGKDRLEALATRLRQDDRPVRIRALAGASVRRPPRARRLALKRLFAVRDQLVAKGLDRAKLELDAGVLIDEGEKGDRVEISVAPAAPPVRQATAAGKPTPMRQKPARAAVETVAVSQSPARPAPVVKRPAPAVARSTGRAAHSGHTFQVQVGSHKNRPDAFAQADRLKSKLSNLLDGQDIRITTVDLEGRGRYHRVRTGPFPNKDDASAFCRSLKDQGQDCLVVRSKGVQAAARNAQPP